MTAAGRLRRSSIRWTDWGMVWNGRCSTARILTCPNPAAGCTLWDILTPDAPEKYYLSEKQMMQLLPRSGTEHRAAECTTPQYLQLCYTINGFLLRIIRGRSTTLYRDAIRIDPNTSLYSAQRLNEIVFFNFHLLEQYDANPSAGVESAIERVVNYVDEHFAEDINLTIVASNLGYTSGYISRLFKQARGVKFTDYLNRRRIGHSKSLLLTSNKTVKQIACDVGFNSATLFIRIFERYEGITPGEFRRLRP